MKSNMRLSGIMLVLLAASLNGLIPLMVTSVYQSGGHYTNIMFYKGILVAPMALIICLIQKQPIKIDRKKHILCFALSLLHTLTSILLFNAYNYISTGMTTTLHFMYPVDVLLLMMIVFKEKPRFQEIISMLLCVVGVAFLSYFDKGSINLIGVLLALISGAFYAGYIVVLGKSAASSMYPLLFTCFSFMYSAIISGTISIFAGTLNGLTATGWLVMFVSAVSSGAVACFLQLGIKRVGAKTSSVLCVAEPLVSVLIGIAAMNESFSLQSAIGTVLVITAASIASLSGK